MTTAGMRFRKAIEQEKPLQIVGVINAFVALLAEQAGFKAIYLSGAGVANSSYGLPDLGMTTLDNVLEDAMRITNATSLPLLVDIDTGWGNRLMIGRVIKMFENAKAAAIHIEDQDLFNKRCGHRDGKHLVSKDEMVDRIKAAVDSRRDRSFVVMARTDAVAVEGLEAAIDRAIAYVEAGADMLFPEALSNLEDYKRFKDAVKVPILANLTEFGKTPLFHIKELLTANIDMALYPLSVNRTMNLAAQKALKEIRSKGTQHGVLPEMLTRKDLYQVLNYENFENML